MRFVDGKGRLFRLVNVIDLLAVLAVCVVVVAGYGLLMAPYRGAETYPLQSAVVWVRVEVRLPAEQVWMREHAAPGLCELDPRSGEPVAEIVACEADAATGGLVVTARVRALREGEERLTYGRGPLVPGRTLYINTAQCRIEGTVSRVYGE